MFSAYCKFAKILPAAFAPVYTKFTYMNLFVLQQSEFQQRHIGPNEEETAEMLQTIALDSIDQLIDLTVPKNIRLDESLDVAGPVSESEYLNELKKIA